VGPWSRPHNPHPQTPNPQSPIPNNIKKGNKINNF